VEKAVARANSNIALVKYWGNADGRLNVPANSSVSITLDGLYCVCSVEFERMDKDEVLVQGDPAPEPVAAKVSAHLDIVRRLSGRPLPARVEIAFNFPTRCGLASSAALFAALSAAASAASGLELPERQLTRLARRGSGSAARSVCAGFVEWRRGRADAGSFARTFLPAPHWKIADVVAIVDPSPKRDSSGEGHLRAPTSPLHGARVVAAERMVPLVKRCIKERQLGAMGPIVESDAVMMHAVAGSSVPPLNYLRPRTLEVLEIVRELRGRDRIPAYFTIDAGPNVHVLTLPEHEPAVVGALDQVADETRLARPGAGAVVLR
jgi:diphosphomevalonate decarboxylase